MQFFLILFITNAFSTPCRLYFLPLFLIRWLGLSLLSLTYLLLLCKLALSLRFNRRVIFPSVFSPRSSHSLTLSHLNPSSSALFSASRTHKLSLLNSQLLDSYSSLIAGTTLLILYCVWNFDRKLKLLLENWMLQADFDLTLSLRYFKYCYWFVKQNWEIIIAFS